MEILLYFVAIFAGFSVGRISHILGGHLKSPHHWIYGIMIITGGLFFLRNPLAIPVILFGIGLFISDLKDFLKMRLYGVDDVKKKKFWDID